MFGRLIAIAGLALAAPVAAQDAAEPATTEVMVLGMYHLSNPGRDAVNMTVDDVLAPRRQRELQQLAEALAVWKPTMIVVEADAPAPGFELAEYADTESLLLTKRNESVQVGYRLARMLGHRAVYGFDETGGDDEPDYFPLGKVFEIAGETGQKPIVDGLLDEVRRDSEAQQALLPSQTLAGSLLAHNDWQRIEGMHHKVHYGLLTIGDGNRQPGAELNAYWYMRNAKMFGKLAMVAKPGDRVLAIMGSGHATWIRHFVRYTPGYAVVDPTPYLIAADVAGRAGK